MGTDEYHRRKREKKAEANKRLYFGNKSNLKEQKEKIYAENVQLESEIMVLKKTFTDLLKIRMEMIYDEIYLQGGLACHEKYQEGYKDGFAKCKQVINVMPAYRGQSENLVPLGPSNVVNRPKN